MESQKIFFVNESKEKIDRMFLKVTKINNENILNTDINL